MRKIEEIAVLTAATGQFGNTSNDISQIAAQHILSMPTFDPNVALAVLNSLVKEGLIERDGHSLFLTTKGKIALNQQKIYITELNNKIGAALARQY